MAIKSILAISLLGKLKILEISDVVYYILCSDCNSLCIAETSRNVVGRITCQKNYCRQLKWVAA